MVLPKESREGYMSLRWPEAFYEAVLKQFNFIRDHGFSVLTTREAKGGDYCLIVF